VELPLGVGNRVLHAQSTEGGSREVSIRSRSMPPTRARDFAVDQETLYAIPSTNERSPRPSFTYSPPAPHISHRTIMEQQGLVEMTPSRPELWHRKEHPLGTPLRELSPSRVTSSLSVDVETLPQRTLEVPRVDTRSSAPPALEQGAAVAPTDSSINIPSTPATTLEPLAVLVVDDDALTRKLMTRMLTRLGCNVTTAENGVKALEILLGSMFTPSESATPSTLVPSTPGTVNSGSDHLTNQPRSFDVVFLDNQMPQMSGLEAISRLRAAGRDDLVVGVTGNALIRDQDEYLNAGVDHVLIKPVLEKSLQQMLSLARRRTACKITEFL
jgi:osomolarity two-component system sensor histidine kinase SLN1